jgi:hypothetical protein
MTKRPMVFQLRSKARFLLTHSVPLDKVDAVAEIGLNGLHEKAKARGYTLPLDSLQDAMRFGSGLDGGADGDDHLGMAHQKILAALFQFDVGLPHNKRGWPEWSDPQADDETRPKDRRDTAELFKKRYLQEFAPPERDTTEPLKDEPRKPVSSIDGLASVELKSNQPGDGHSHVGVDISCGRTRIDVSHYEIALRSAVLSIDCGLGKAKLSTVWGYGKPDFIVTGSHGEVRCACTANTQKQHWRLDASGTTLGTFVLDTENKVFVERLAHGDVIMATLATWLKYIAPDDSEAASHPADGDIALLDRTGGEVKLDAKRLTVEQQRIIEHLAKRRLNTDENNYAVVARHEIEFVRRR